jgi:hypothetical protein
MAPQRSRVFLFVLGYGRLQGGPVKGLDAAVNFVRRRLLPQDHVAVFAYNRATDFTLDHEKVAQVLERFRAENDWITAGIRQQMSGLAALYGSREVSVTVQRRIDAVFGGAERAPSRVLDPGENARTGERLKADQQRLADQAADAVIAAGRITAVSVDSSPPPDTGADSWRTFDGFVTANAQTLQDVGNLYAAVAYMQKIDGEKHLVFVTESGVDLPRSEDFEDLAAMAANGRVALDVLQTGRAEDVTSNRLLRSLADDSGGLASIASTGEAALERLDEATRVSYLLAYYPTNATWNGARRVVTVKVNRAGVDLAYRRSYRADPNVPAFDRRAYTTRFRLAAAMRYDRDVSDIGVKLSASGAWIGGEPAVAIDARIDVSRLHFELQDGLRIGRVEIAVLFMDAKDQVLGGTYKKQTAHLEYDPSAFASVTREGVPYQVQMRAPSGTRYIRVIVYDYAADLIGTAGAWVR